MTTLFLENLKDIDQVAGSFIKNMGKNKVFAMYGDMGAGKTTFIKAICRELGVIENMSSPTFALVNEYVTETMTIYHFDCYRLKNIVEAYDIGAEEYFYSGNLCFVEWPEKIADLLPDQHTAVHIEVLPNKKRKISIEE